VAQDLEPEYLTYSPDGTMAVVACQENNALAFVDLATATVTQIQGMALTDHSKLGFGFDGSSRDGYINIHPYPVFGMHMPDGIASYRYAATDFYISAGEGDDRGDFGDDWRGDVADFEDLNIDPTAYPNADALADRNVIGKLNCSVIDGLSGEGEIEKVHIYGTRSFRITDQNGVVIFDSGEQFERIIADRFADTFNMDVGFDGDEVEEIAFEDRSPKSGPEPEGVTIGYVGSRVLAFIGIEKHGGIMVYDITNPYYPFFVDYLNNRDFASELDETDGNGNETPDAWEDINGNGMPDGFENSDLGPEGLVFVEAANSPTGKALLIVANEVSGTVSVYEIE
jgi:hypothetical protein